MKYLLFIILGVFSTTLLGYSDVVNRPEQLSKVMKSFGSPVPLTKLLNIATAASDTSAKCGLPVVTLLAVAFAESSWREDPPNSHDVGIMQFNTSTIKQLKLNPKRLKKDVKYSLRAGCNLILENKEKYSKTRSYWLGIYHAGTKFNEPAVVIRAKKYDAKIKKISKMIISKYHSQYDWKIAKAGN